MANGSVQGHQDNRLLAGLPRDMLELMARDLRQISLAQNQQIYEPGAPIEEVYFPQSGMISLLVVAKDGGAVETATIGRDGGRSGCTGHRGSGFRSRGPPRKSAVSFQSFVPALWRFSFKTTCRYAT